MSVFNALDDNGDGVISMAELMNWFAYDFVMNSDERLWDFVKMIDYEMDGKITRKKCERVLGERRKMVA